MAPSPWVRILPVAAAAVVLVSLAACPARAQRTPRQCAQALSDAELDARIDGIQRRLDGGSRSARWWYYSWLFGMVAAGAGQLTWALVTDDVEVRRQRYVGMTGAFLTVGALLIRPMSAAWAAPRLRRAPRGSHEERVEALRYGERLLMRAARRQRMAHAWLEYVQVVAYTLTTSLLLGVRWDDGAGAAVNVATALVVGNARIITAPTRAIVDWDAYQTAPDACFTRHLRPREPETSVSVHPAGLGLALTVSFPGPRL